MYKRKLKHDYDTIYQRHLGGESIINISKDTGIHVQSIYAHFQKNNWEYNNDIQIRQAGYFVDDNHLDNVDTEDKAYFLGWMLSDGCVSKNTLRINLKRDDEYIIKEMFNKFSTGYKSTIYKNNKSMSLSSTKMIHALKNLGCVENKTEVGFDLPDISKDLFRHFVRGYFDGDGSIGVRSERPNQILVSICSINEKFLIQLQEKLCEHNILSTIYKENRKDKSLKRPDGRYSINNKDMFRLTIQTHKEKLKFYELLYNNCTIKLTRKYDKYREYYNSTTLRLEKKNSEAELVLKLFKEGKCEFAIHKETNIGRHVIKRVLSKL